MTYTYKTQGTCSSSIELEIKDGIILNVLFRDGCNGNLQGIAKLAQGRPVTEVIGLLQGIQCGSSRTSCPDQLSKALLEFQAENNK